MKDVTETPSHADDIQRVLKSKSNEVKKHSPSKALSLFVEADMTRHQWEVMAMANKKVLPSYSTIQKEKQKTYPEKK